MRNTFRENNFVYGKNHIFSVLDGKTAHRVPAMLHCFMAAAGEAGITMKEYREDPVKMAECLINFADKYKLDGIMTDMDTAMEAHALGAQVDFPEHEPARAEGPAKGTLDQIIESVDWRKLQACDRIQVYLEGLRLIKKWNPNLCLRGNADQGPFSIAMLLYGMENFMMGLLDEEVSAKLSILMDRCFDVHLAFHRMCSETGADLTSFGDSSCGPDLISRDLYRTYALPRHIRLKRELDKLGIRSICHICGKLDDILEDIASVRFTGVEVDYKTDLIKARDSLRDHSTVFGTIDPSGVFFFGTPDQVAGKTKEVLGIFGGRGLVIGAGCALPRGVPEENLFSFVRTVHEFDPA